MDHAPVALLKTPRKRQKVLILVLMDHAPVEGVR